MIQAVKKVELVEKRYEFIHYLRDLSDEEYQRYNWHNPKNNYGFWGGGLKYVVNLIFDEQCMERFLEDKIAPYGFIGEVLKNRKEAEALYKVVELLDKLLDDAPNNTDEEYLNSIYLEPTRKAAKEAFDVFMESEQDNHFLLNQIKYVEEHKKDPPKDLMRLWYKQQSN